MAPAAGADAGAADAATSSCPWLMLSCSSASVEALQSADSDAGCKIARIHRVKQGTWHTAM